MIDYKILNQEESDAYYSLKECGRLSKEDLQDYVYADLLFIRLQHLPNVFLKNDVLYYGTMPAIKTRRRIARKPIYIANKKYENLKKKDESHKFVIRKKTQPINDEINFAFKNNNHGGDLSLNFEDALDQAKEVFEKATLLYYSYLVTLNPTLAPKLYNYFKKSYPCTEISKGTLKLSKRG